MPQEQLIHRITKEAPVIRILSAIISICILVAATPAKTKRAENALSADLVWARVEASSTLADRGSYERYGAKNLNDGGGESWAEGATGSGIGESLTVRFEEKRTNAPAAAILDRLYIKNGFGDLRYYYRNNRVKELLVDGGGERFTVSLRDTPETQELLFPKPIASDRIILTIAAVYPGNRDDDTCIAELDINPISFGKKSGAALAALNDAAAISDTWSEVSVLILRQRAQSLTLKRNGDRSVTGDARAGGQSGAPIIRGSWTRIGNALAVTYTFKEECIDMGIGDPCRNRKTLTESVVFVKFTPDEVIDSHGNAGRIGNWL
jgi:hypothetical protein